MCITLIEEMFKLDEHDTIEIQPIGIIHSPFKSSKGTPIQPKGSHGVEGKVIIYTPYVPGLRGIDGFSHVFLLYYFHKIRETSLSVIPFMDVVKRGVFATRAPVRPNHIGISVVELTGIRGNVLLVKNVDILDGTPLIDIKPYVFEFDSFEHTKSGWVENRDVNLGSVEDDGRFTI